MTTARLCADSNGDVSCPKRGLIDVEWCFGCPHRTQTEWVGDQAVVECDPGVAPPYRQATWGPLHDVPADFKMT
jgi:hypothetical protein